MSAFPYGRVAVVTGASSGIGLACAQAFAEKGYRVWALSRRAGVTPVLGDGRIIPLRCDVCDDTSVQNAVAQILASEDGEVGIVLHSAGMGIAGASEDTPLDSVRAQWEVNYLGVLRLNRLLLPAMRARGCGLVLVMGSMAGLLPIPYQGHYSSTKYALEAYCETLRMESRPFGLRVCILEPGDTRTGFTEARSIVIPNESPHGDACRRAVDRMAHDEKNGHPPEKVARVAMRVAARKNPPVRRAVGLSYKTLALLRRLLPSSVVQWLLRIIYLR